MSERRCPDCRMPAKLHEEIGSALEAGALADPERDELARLALSLPAPTEKRRVRVLPALPLAAAAAAVALVFALMPGRTGTRPAGEAGPGDVEAERAANYRAFSLEVDNLNSMDRRLYVAFADGRMVAWTSDPEELDRVARARFPKAQHRLFFQMGSVGDRTVARDVSRTWKGKPDLLYEIPGWAVADDPARGPVALRRYLLPDGEGGYREWDGHPGAGPPPLRLGGRVWPHAGEEVHREAVRSRQPVLELRGHSGLVRHDLLADPAVRARLGDYLLSYFFFENPIDVEADGVSLHLDPAPRLVVLGMAPPREGAQPMYVVGDARTPLYDRDELLLQSSTSADDIAVFLDRFRPVDDFQWVRVPAGTFLSGSPDRPETVVVPAFEILVTEVTNRQWARYCGDRGIPFEVPSDRYDHPVTGISFNQANDFCSHWLARRFPGARLPTPAEWQKAARGSEDTRAWPWGDEWGKGSPANVLEAGIGATLPVRTMPRDVSPYGVRDMAGYIGGCFRTDALDARVWVQTEIDISGGFGWDFVGFRAVRSVE